MLFSPAGPKGYAMKPKTLAWALSIVSACVVGGGAGAGIAAGHVESNCADRASVVDRLAVEYGETHQAIGLASAREVVEIFASDETGSWTITVTGPDGRTCLVAAGTCFERFDKNPTPAVTGDPA